eukprot:gnl/Chilomastix_cuspidata/6034.p1 GENE.gnl/Chilomastix_cuspidata/6034~~gnl/Chilomastix_cuspidata/6034.p1  ORF type:complete len:3446 (-),score=793.65 gnl/Chilomastix_cuspidata/6034:66-10403(-)
MSEALGGYEAQLRLILTEMSFPLSVDPSSFFTSLTETSLRDLEKFCTSSHTRTLYISRESEDADYRATVHFPQRYTLPFVFFIKEQSRPLVERGALCKLVRGYVNTDGLSLLHHFIRGFSWPLIMTGDYAKSLLFSHVGTALEFALGVSAEAFSFPLIPLQAPTLDDNLIVAVRDMELWVKSSSSVVAMAHEILSSASAVRHIDTYEEFMGVLLVASRRFPHLAHLGAVAPESEYFRRYFSTSGHVFLSTFLEYRVARRHCRHVLDVLESAQTQRLLTACAGLTCLLPQRIANARVKIRSILAESETAFALLRALFPFILAAHATVADRAIPNIFRLAEVIKRLVRGALDVRLSHVVARAVASLIAKDLTLVVRECISEVEFPAAFDRLDMLGELAAALVQCRELLTTGERSHEDLRKIVDTALKQTTRYVSEYLVVVRRMRTVAERLDAAREFEQVDTSHLDAELLQVYALLPRHFGLRPAGESRHLLEHAAILCSGIETRLDTLFFEFFSERLPMSANIFAIIEFIEKIVRAPFFFNLNDGRSVHALVEKLFANFSQFLTAGVDKTFGTLTSLFVTTAPIARYVFATHLLYHLTYLPFRAFKEYPQIYRETFFISASLKVKTLWRTRIRELAQVAQTMAAAEAEQIREFEALLEGDVLDTDAGRLIVLSRSIRQAAEFRDAFLPLSAMHLPCEFCTNDFWATTLTEMFRAAPGPRPRVPDELQGEAAPLRAFYHNLHRAAVFKTYYSSLGRSILYLFSKHFSDGASVKWADSRALAHAVSLVGAKDLWLRDAFRQIHQFFEQTRNDFLPFCSDLLVPELEEFRMFGFGEVSWHTFQAIMDLDSFRAFLPSHLLQKTRPVQEAHALFMEHMGGVLGATRAQVDAIISAHAERFKNIQQNLENVSLSALSNGLLEFFEGRLVDATAVLFCFLGRMLDAPTPVLSLAVTDQKHGQWKTSSPIFPEEGNESTETGNSCASSVEGMLNDMLMFPLRLMDLNAKIIRKLGFEALEDDALGLFTAKVSLISREKVQKLNGLYEQLRAYMRTQLDHASQSLRNLDKTLQIDCPEFGGVVNSSSIAHARQQFTDLLSSIQQAKFPIQPGISMLELQTSMCRESLVDTVRQKRALYNTRLQEALETHLEELKARAHQVIDGIKTAKTQLSIPSLFPPAMLEQPVPSAHTAVALFEAIAEAREFLAETGAALLSPGAMASKHLELITFLRNEVELALESASEMLETLREGLMAFTESYTTSLLAFEKKTKRKLCKFVARPEVAELQLVDFDAEAQPLYEAVRCSEAGQKILTRLSQLQEFKQTFSHLPDTFRFTLTALRSLLAIRDETVALWNSIGRRFENFAAVSTDALKAVTDEGAVLLAALEEPLAVRVEVQFQKHTKAAIRFCQNRQEIRHGVFLDEFLLLRNIPVTEFITNSLEQIMGRFHFLQELPAQLRFEYSERLGLNPRAGESLDFLAPSDEQFEAEAKEMSRVVEDCKLQILFSDLKHFTETRFDIFSRSQRRKGAELAALVVALPFYTVSEENVRYVRQCSALLENLQCCIRLFNRLLLLHIVTLLVSRGFTPEKQAEVSQVVQSSGRRATALLNTASTIETLFANLSHAQRELQEPEVLTCLALELDDFEQSLKGHFSEGWTLPLFALPDLVDDFEVTTDAIELLAGAPQRYSEHPADSLLQKEFSVPDVFVHKPTGTRLTFDAQKCVISTILGDRLHIAMPETDIHKNPEVCLFSATFQKKICAALKTHIRAGSEIARGIFCQFLASDSLSVPQSELEPLVAEEMTCVSCLVGMRQFLEDARKECARVEENIGSAEEVIDTVRNLKTELLNFVATVAPRCPQSALRLIRVLSPALNVLTAWLQEKCDGPAVGRARSQVLLGAHLFEEGRAHTEIEFNDLLGGFSEQSPYLFLNTELDVWPDALETLKVFVNNHRALSCHNLSPAFLRSILYALAGAGGDAWRRSPEGCITDILRLVVGIRSENSPAYLDQLFRLDAVPGVYLTVPLLDSVTKALKHFFGEKEDIIRFALLLHIAFISSPTVVIRTDNLHITRHIADRIMRIYDQQPSARRGSGCVRERGSHLYIVATEADVIPMQRHISRGELRLILVDPETALPAHIRNALPSMTLHWRAAAPLTPFFLADWARSFPSSFSAVLLHLQHVFRTFEKLCRNASVPSRHLALRTTFEVARALFELFLLRLRRSLKQKEINTIVIFAAFWAFRGSEELPAEGKRFDDLPQQMRLKNSFALGFRTDMVSAQDTWCGHDSAPSRKVIEGLVAQHPSFYRNHISVSRFVPSVVEHTFVLSRLSEVTERMFGWDTPLLATLVMPALFLCLKMRHGGRCILPLKAPATFARAEVARIISRLFRDSPGEVLARAFFGADSAGEGAIIIYVHPSHLVATDPGRRCAPLCDRLSFYAPDNGLLTAEAEQRSLPSTFRAYGIANPQSRKIFSEVELLFSERWALRFSEFLDFSVLPAPGRVTPAVFFEHAIADLLFVEEDTARELLDRCCALFRDVPEITWEAICMFSRILRGQPELGCNAALALSFMSFAFFSDTKSAKEATATLAAFIPAHPRSAPDTAVSSSDGSYENDLESVFLVPDFTRDTLGGMQSPLSALFDSASGAYLTGAEPQFVLHFFTSGRLFETELQALSLTLMRAAFSSLAGVIVRGSREIFAEFLQNMPASRLLPPHVTPARLLQEIEGGAQSGANARTPFLVLCEPFELSQEMFDLLSELVVLGFSRKASLQRVDMAPQWVRPLVFLQEGSPALAAWRTHSPRLFHTCASAHIFGPAFSQNDLFQYIYLRVLREGLEQVVDEPLTEALVDVFSQLCAKFPPQVIKETVNFFIVLAKRQLSFIDEKAASIREAASLLEQVQSRTEQNLARLVNQEEAVFQDVLREEKLAETIARREQAQSDTYQMRARKLLELERTSLHAEAMRVVLARCESELLSRLANIKERLAVLTRVVFPPLGTVPFLDALLNFVSIFVNAIRSGASGVSLVGSKVLPGRVVQFLAALGPLDLTLGSAEVFQKWLRMVSHHEDSSRPLLRALFGEGFAGFTMNAPASNRIPPDLDESAEPVAIVFAFCCAAVGAASKAREAAHARERLAALIKRRGFFSAQIDQLSTTISKNAASITRLRSQIRGANHEYRHTNALKESAFETRKLIETLHESLQPFSKKNDASVDTIVPDSVFAALSLVLFSGVNAKDSLAQSNLVSKQLRRAGFRTGPILACRSLPSFPLDERLGTFAIGERAYSELAQALLSAGYTGSVPSLIKGAVVTAITERAPFIIARDGCVTALVLKIAQFLASTEAALPDFAAVTACDAAPAAGALDARGNITLPDDAHAPFLVLDFSDHDSEGIVEHIARSCVQAGVRLVGTSAHLPRTIYAFQAVRVNEGDLQTLESKNSISGMLATLRMCLAEDADAAAIRRWLQEMTEKRFN